MQLELKASKTLRHLVDLNTRNHKHHHQADYSLEKHIRLFTLITNILDRRGQTLITAIYRLFYINQNPLTTRNLLQENSRNLLPRVYRVVYRGQSRIPMSTTGKSDSYSMSQDLQLGISIKSLGKEQSPGHGEMS